MSLVSLEPNLLYLSHMTMLRPYIFIILALIIPTKTFTQLANLSTAENRLANLYKQIISSSEKNSDSTDIYVENFNSEFTNYIQHNPSTLHFRFQKLDTLAGIFIHTSADGRFRVYNWHTWNGGTMHMYKTIYQWKAKDKVFTENPAYEEGDPGSFCSAIFTVQTNNATYYLPVTNGVYSTKDMSQSIAVYTIRNSKLIDTVNLFQTKTERHNLINVEFDFFSVVDRPERPLQLIIYDDKKKKLYIPVVTDIGQVTSRNIVYQFKGNLFVYAGIEAIQATTK